MVQRLRFDGVIGHFNQSIRIEERQSAGETASYGPVEHPEIFFGKGGSTNSVEDREQRERGSGSIAP